MNAAAEEVCKVQWGTQIPIFVEKKQKLGALDLFVQSVISAIIIATLLCLAVIHDMNIFFSTMHFSHVPI